LGKAHTKTGRTRNKIAACSSAFSPSYFVLTGADKGDRIAPTAARNMEDHTENHRVTAGPKNAQSIHLPQAAELVEGEGAEREKCEVRVASVELVEIGGIRVSWSPVVGRGRRGLPVRIGICLCGRR
jgi:hypothetical protein